MAFSVADKPQVWQKKKKLKKQTTTVVVELIPIVCSQFSHSALWWLCQHLFICSSRLGLYLIKLQKVKQRLLHTTTVCVCVVYGFIYFIYRALICLSLRFNFLGGPFGAFASCGLQISKKKTQTRMHLFFCAWKAQRDRLNVNWSKT